MEALRVRAAANGDVVGVFGQALADHELSLAVPAVETGTMNRSASILIQAGFNSRLAAIKVVADTGATFTTGAELRARLRSPGLAAWSAQPEWSTSETRGMWLEFRSGIRAVRQSDLGATRLSWERTMVRRPRTAGNACWPLSSKWAATGAGAMGIRSACCSTRSIQIGAALCERKLLRMSPSSI